MVQIFPGYPVKAMKKEYLERFHLFSKNIPPGRTRITENSIQMVFVHGPCACERSKFTQTMFKLSSLELIKTEMYQSRMLMRFCYVFTVFQSQHIWRTEHYISLQRKTDDQSVTVAIQYMIKSCKEHLLRLN